MRTTRGTGRAAWRNAVLGVLMIGLAGCMTPAGDGATPAEPGGADEPTEEAAVTGLPLLQVRQSGGFVLAGTDFRTVPEVTVYADGQVISHGPQLLVYPPPALPNLLTHELTAEDVAAVVAAAREAGLLEEAPDYGQPPIADVPATVVELHVDGETVRHEVQALGVEEGPDGTAPGADPDAAGGASGDLGLTQEQVTARARLSEFLTTAREITGVGEAGEETSYEITAFAVMARPAVPAPAEDGLEPGVFPWPLTELALAELEECTSVTGDQAVTLREALTDAATTSLVEQDGALYELWPRPLLPHEEGCEDLL
ncbi:hypothetical protein J4G33_15155 [Actinotalea sp. BY-33]|uniref:PASTA domain-containing protein n=1 Tax=Actinotalea soli TaxID=2819234 RepID=A0A939LR21_9CELL|nr:hypothetical protein [Actinotalea soli]MBO1753147.1 hypothetical protein [Actinotalea soli]